MTSSEAPEKIRQARYRPDAFLAFLCNYEKSLWLGFGAHLAGQMDRPDAPDARFSKEIAPLLIKPFSQTLSVYFERCCGLGLEHIPPAIVLTGVSLKCRFVHLSNVRRILHLSAGEGYPGSAHSTL